MPDTARNQSPYEELVVFCCRKAARVHFEGAADAAGKGGSKDGKSGSVKDGSGAAAESKAGPEKQGDAPVGVTIPR